MRRIISYIIFISLVLVSGQALCEEETVAKTGKNSSSSNKVVVSGKAYCSLKRAVIMPFHGIITSVEAQSGKPVKKGQTLARYSLEPEVALKLRKQVSTFHIKDLEMQLAGVEKSLSELTDKQKDLTQLAKHNMASSDSLISIQNEIELLKKKRDLITQRLPVERSLIKEQRALLSRRLGTAVPPDDVSRNGAMVAPISGHVVWVSHEIRNGAEPRPEEPAFMVGVMDPMVMYTIVYEKEVVRLKVGDLADIEIESLKGRNYEGRISRISWTPKSQNPSNPAYYEVELSVPNKDLSLREGFKGTITFRETD